MSRRLRAGRAAKRSTSNGPSESTPGSAGTSCWGTSTGIGRVRRVLPQTDFHVLTIDFEQDLAPYLVQKGSIAVDGISLTVAALRAEAFDVQIVPYTWGHTALHSVGADAAVNLECDIIGKYVVRAVRETA